MKLLIRLYEYAGWSGPSQSAYVRSHVFACHHPNDLYSTPIFFFQKIGLNIHIKLFRKKQNKTKLELSADLTIASLQRCQRRNTHCNEIFRFHAYQIHHCRTWQHGNVKPIKEFKSMSYGSLALTLVYTVYQPTLHMCTRFQLVTLQFLRKVLQFFFH